MARNQTVFRHFAAAPTPCEACLSGAPDELCTCGLREEICEDCELPLTACACDEAHDYDHFASFKDTLD